MVRWHRHTVAIPLPWGPQPTSLLTVDGTVDNRPMPSKDSRKRHETVDGSISKSNFNFFCRAGITYQDNSRQHQEKPVSTVHLLSLVYGRASLSFLNCQLFYVNFFFPVSPDCYNSFPYLIFKPLSYCHLLIPTHESFLFLTLWLIPSLPILFLSLDSFLRYRFYYWTMTHNISYIYKPSR